eukprot:g7860.t1
MSNPISKSDFRRVDPRMHLIEEDPVPTGAKSSTNFKNIEKQIVKNLTNSTKAIPRQRMDSQSPEIAEAVNFALNLINKKVEQKRTARVINIIKAFKEAHKLDDDVLYYEATVQLRRANGRIEFQDIKVGKNVNTGKWVMKSHGLRPSFVFDMNVLLLDVTSKKGITAVGGWDSWNTQPGVKGLLTYLHTRGLKAGLLPSFDIVGKPGLVEKGIAALSDQVQYKFNHVMENNPPSASKQKLSVFSSNIDSLQSKWGVRKEEIMVFSMDEELIATAKEREYFTCALKVQNKNWQAARAADYSVKNMNDVKLVIEELNGISFRNRELFFNRK